MEHVCTLCKGRFVIIIPAALAVLLEPVSVAAVYTEACGSTCCHGNGGLFIRAAVYGYCCCVGGSRNFAYLCAVCGVHCRVPDSQGDARCRGCACAVCHADNEIFICSCSRRCAGNGTVGGDLKPCGTGNLGEGIRSRAACCAACYGEGSDSHAVFRIFDIPCTALHKCERCACGCSDRIFGRIYPYARVVVIHVDRACRPCHAVYRNGNACAVKHVRQACRIVDANLTMESVCTFCKGRFVIIIPAALAVLLEPVSVAAVYTEACGSTCCHGNGGLFIRAAVYGYCCCVGGSRNFAYLCAVYGDSYRCRSYAEAGGIVYEVNGIEFQLLQIRCQIARYACVYLALEGGDNRV